MMSSAKGQKRDYNRYKNYKPKSNNTVKETEKNKNVDENNPITKCFRQYASEIDEKHDRHERIFKISRDITIESKRIIFLLHSVDKDYKQENVLKEANQRLNVLITNHFKNIAKELENQDPFLYLRAYTAGLQEFIEALTFYQYIEKKNIEHWNKIEQQFRYDVPCDPEAEETEEKTTENKLVVTTLPATEYMLGLADLTGELMRMCINHLGSGNIDSCFRTCAFVREIYNGFLIIGSGCKEMSRKLYTLKQSLFKMEMVCYNITVRGSEVPKHMLANILTSRHTEMSTGEEVDDDY